MVAVENFSGFVITSFSKSEKSEDLYETIYQAVYPFKSGATVKMRVDQAPGFRKLFSQKNLKSNDILLELGEAKNANSLAICDRKMQELQKEMKKISPSGNVVDVQILSKATNMVNEKIRNQGLSAKEILFSRD